ncbi:T9SS type A sorting domain-containing protein [bacterium]|nr:T9SS type A sorting domain-containing protein [bacterium]
MHHFWKQNTQIQLIRKVSLLLLLFSNTIVFAQYEEVTPLYRNQVIINYLQKQKDKPAALAYKKLPVLSIPFFDDFSSTKIYPDKARWADRSVYVNNGFAINPPSHGVATFDGLDKRGYPYNVDGNNFPKSCDTLTSNYIDLSGFGETDSLYLSFYLQQKGMGESPEKDDSFMLEFHAENGEWREMWATNGQFDSSGYYPFKQIMVKIPDRASFRYFHDSFQFRFRNYGNRTGALDHWNLDYVYLDKNRTQADTVLEDVSIYRQPKGLFNVYYSMPWRYFKQDRETYLNSTIDFHVYNKALNKQSPDIFYTIRDANRVDTPMYSSLSERNQINDISPFTQKTGSQKNMLPYTYFNNLDTQTAKIELKLTVKSRNLVGGPELLKQNDVMVIHQYFGEYLAYDDGSAEGGYGLKNTRQGGVALKFSIKGIDTIKYIAFSFTGGNEVLPDKQKFNLIIWERLYPTPVELMKMTGLHPIYSELYNGFALYKLDKPLVISGEFFVGWEQNIAYNLNVGIDLDYRFFNDNKPNPNLYFNAAGTWENSKIVGTPMIRPVFGEHAMLSAPRIERQAEIICYPNPVTNVLQIVLPDNNNGMAAIYNTNGQMLLSENLGQHNMQLDLSALPAGLYLLRVETEKGAVFNKTLVKK